MVAEGSSTSSNERLRMEGVRKTFGATKALSGVDLVVNAGEVLALVGKCAPEAVTQKKIQCCLRVEAATLTGVVDGLVRRGWLTRRENAEDRRVNELCLTDGGKAVYSELAPWVTKSVAKRIQQGLTPAQVAEAKTILQQIAANLEAD